MKTMARPDGPGSSPSGPTPTGSAGKAATIPRAAKRETADDVAREYLQTYRQVSGAPPTFRLMYANGWFEFWYGEKRTRRVRRSELAAMTARINARRAQETEARRAETLGSACEGSVGEADAPIPSLTSEP